MRELDLKGDFHAVINWGGSFGYYDEAVNLNVLRRLAQALRPRGRLLVDTANRERVLRSFVAEDTVQVPARGGKAGGTLTKPERWNPRYQRVEGVWTFRRGRREIVCPMRVRLYTPGQYKKLLSRVGLAFETLYGPRTGDPYLSTSRRTVIVGRRMD